MNDPNTSAIADYKSVLKEVIEEIRGSQIADFTDTADLMDDLAVNSLEMIHIFLKLEDRYGIRLEFEKLELADLRSVERFIGFIGKHAGAAK